MPLQSAGPLHAFLAGVGRDSRNRLAADVLAFSDRQLEQTHDYVQWLFPLPSRSAAQPDAPVLTDAEIKAIRNDPRAAGTLETATHRMARFYRDTDGWLAWQDHNHLRITRIIKSLRLLASPDSALQFYSEILELNAAAGSPVNPRSRQFWTEAAAR